MGLDINSLLIVGYKVYFKKNKTNVIRFREDTGESYNKIIEEIICSEENIQDDLEDFFFGQINLEEEYTAIRGKKIKRSRSHRNIDDQIEMFLEIDVDVLMNELNEMKKKHPQKNIKAYSCAQASW